MAEQDQTPIMTKDVRISPEESVHKQIEKVQAFIEFTTGERPNKAETCVRLIKEGITRYDAIMRETINA